MMDVRVVFRATGLRMLATGCKIKFAVSIDLRRLTATIVASRTRLAALRSASSAA